MSTFYNEDGTFFEGQICSYCKDIIYGNLQISKDEVLVVNDFNVVTGICIGMDWIEYYGHIECIKKEKEDLENARED